MTFNGITSFFNHTVDAVALPAVSSTLVIVIIVLISGIVIGAVFFLVARRRRTTHSADISQQAA